MTPIAIMQTMVISALMDSFTWFLLKDRNIAAWVNCIAGLTKHASPHKKVGYLLLFCITGYTLAMLTKEQAIQLAGSQAKLARLLGISRAAVWLWKTIPQARIWQLRVLRPEWFEVIDP
jgi:DNA-binding transcriptional regulator Cro